MTRAEQHFNWLIRVACTYLIVQHVHCSVLTTERPDPCDSTPCNGQGTCLSYETTDVQIFPKYKVTKRMTFQCQCDYKYRGSQCQYHEDHMAIPNPCVSNPCQNNGICDWNAFTVEGNADHLYYQCTCPNNVKGDRCHLTEDPCKGTNPCQNNGTCSWREGVSVIAPDDQYSTYQCACRAGYRGDLCHIHKDPCLQITCHHGGICSWLSDGSAECRCPKKFKGLFCEFQEESVCNINQTEGFITFGYKLIGNRGTIPQPQFPGNYRNIEEWQRKNVGLYSANLGCSYYLVLTEEQKRREDIIKITWDSPLTYFIGCAITNDMYLIGISHNVHAFFAKAQQPLECNRNMTASCTFIKAAAAFHMTMSLQNQHTGSHQTNSMGFTYEIISRDALEDQSCHITTHSPSTSTIRTPLPTTFQPQPTSQFTEKTLTPIIPALTTDDRTEIGSSSPSQSQMSYALIAWTGAMCLYLSTSL